MEGTPEVGSHSIQGRLAAVEAEVAAGGGGGGPEQARLNYISVANANGNDISATEVAAPYPEVPSFVHANLTPTNLVGVYVYYKGPGAPENPSPRHTAIDITDEVTVTEGGEIDSPVTDFAVLSDQTCIVFYHPSQP